MYILCSPFFKIFHLSVAVPPPTVGEPRDGNYLLLCLLTLIEQPINRCQIYFILYYIYEYINFSRTNINFVNILVVGLIVRYGIK